MEGVAVPRSGTLLFETFAVSQGLVAFTENGIAVAFATTAFGNDIAFGVVIYEVAQIRAGKVNIAQGFSVFTGKQCFGFGFLRSEGFLRLGKIDYFNDIHLLFCCSRRGFGFIRRCFFRLCGKCSRCDS